MMIGKPGEARSAIATADARSITVRGKDLCRELMGKLSFTEFFLLHLTGRMPTERERFFIDVLLVSIAEHGLTPSVQAARMTYAAGPEAFQAAVGAGILGCGSVILGSSEQCAALLREAASRAERDGLSAADAALALAQEIKAAGRTVPGFGHSLHRPVDPRAERILALADEHAVAGRYCALLRAFAPAVAAVWGKPLPINVQGPIAAVVLDLGLPDAAIKGIPLLARTAGLIGHLAEESQRPIGFLMAHRGETAIEYDGGGG